MRAATVAVLFSSTAMMVQAKEPPAYEKAVLVQMDSSACGYTEKDGKTIAGEIFGTDGQHKNTKQLLCQEYVLQTDRVTYRIQPKDDKHPVLLPVGETAQFRIHKDKMLLRVPENGRQGTRIHRSLDDSAHRRRSGQSADDFGSGWHSLTSQAAASAPGESS